jgi:molybdopterin converting factor small subunit
MSITTLFFGATADLVGAREIKFDDVNGSTVAEVLARLKQTNPDLSKHKLLVALNEEYVSLDTSVKDGDTLAIFTAVSGG